MNKSWKLSFEGDIEEIDIILDSIQGQKISLLETKINLLVIPNEYTESQLSSLDEMIKDIDDIKTRIIIEEV